MSFNEFEENDWICCTDMVKKVDPVHPNQKGNKTMARPRPESARETEEIYTYTLVRGATGALYLISETEKPRELKGKEKEDVMKILDDCEDKLSKSVEMIGAIGIRRVCVGVSTVFVKHR
jgi:hypothetical protein